MSIRREVNKPIKSFNDQFHQAYMRLQNPYVLNDAIILPVYYATLDNLTAMLVKRMNPPLARLVDAYLEAVIANIELGKKI